nr:acyl carrier protein [uncultured Oscillibacter sp.]
MEFEKVRDVIVETLGCDAEQVTLEATLAEDLGADSLASVELVMALEEATGISIDDADVANLKTVGDIMTYLNSHKN